MEPKWLTWIYDHMPKDYLDEYLADTEHTRACLTARIRELETRLLKYEEEII